MLNNTFKLGKNIVIAFYQDGATHLTIPNK